MGPWRARVTRWLVHTIAREDSETCDACGRRVPGSWWAESDRDWITVYEHIMGSPPAVTSWGVSGGLLCPGCFAQGATDIRMAVIVTFGDLG